MHMYDRVASMSLVGCRESRLPFLLSGTVVDNSVSRCPDHAPTKS